MLDAILRKKKASESIKCIKCKEKDATQEDQMCDSCRYMLALDNIISSRK